jgi:hypothetical protein
MSGGGCTDEFDFLDPNNGGLASPSPSPAPSQLSISAGSSVSEVESGKAVTYTVQITGGTQPYFVYWFLEGDNAWTLGGEAHTRTLEGTDGQQRLLYCQVVDANNTQSNQAVVTVTIRVPQSSIGCDSIVGRWRTVQGIMVFEDLGNNSFFAAYGHEVGGEVVADGSLDGLLSRGAPGCPDCVVLIGFWQSADGASSGSIEFTFDLDLKSFSGRWSFAENSHWQADFWDGFRDNCN